VDDAPPLDETLEALDALDASSPPVAAALPPPAPGVWDPVEVAVDVASTPTPPVARSPLPHAKSQSMALAEVAGSRVRWW